MVFIPVGGVLEQRAVLLPGGIKFDHQKPEDLGETNNRARREYQRVQMSSPLIQLPRVAGLVNKCCSNDHCTMGNCIRGMSDKCHEKVRVVSLNGAEKEFKASTPIKRIISGRYQGYKLVQHTKPFSPLPQDSKLEPGGIYYLVPDVPKQLEFLLRNAKKFQSGKLAVRFSESFEQDYWKWYPSLPPIEEVPDF
ncbi:hypothetical protein Patl1_09662 [Pistacia atlantica]|uniref:Uncharacterized protein n=1 Tax=Pistacia atlantica TaxID=434234 RepID=A0ACC1A343_9ROSI|nr:hypothetical protein Patl1_09662 [Pistacia atlantica]